MTRFKPYLNPPPQKEENSLPLIKNFAQYLLKLLQLHVFEIYRDAIASTDVE